MSLTKNHDEPVSAAQRLSNTELADAPTALPLGMHISDGRLTGTSGDTFELNESQQVRRRGRRPLTPVDIDLQMTVVEPNAKSQRKEHVSRVDLRNINIIVPPENVTESDKPKRKRGRNWKRYKGIGKGHTLDGTRKRRGYSKETLVEAVEAVRNGTNMYQAHRQFGVPVSTLFAHIHGLRNGPIGSYRRLRPEEQAALDDAYLAARHSLENGAPLVRLRIRATMNATQTRAAYECGAVIRREGESMRRLLEELITIELRSAPLCESEQSVELAAHRADLESLILSFPNANFEKRMMVRCFSAAQVDRVVAAYASKTQQVFDPVSSDAIKTGLYARLPPRANLFNRDRTIQFQSDGRKRVQLKFDGIPWLYLGERHFICYECGRLMAEEPNAPSPVVIQRNCPSRICVLNIFRFPQYKLLNDSYKGRVCCSSVVMRDWDSDQLEVIAQSVFYVFLPSVRQHCHSITLAAGPSDSSAGKLGRDEQPQDSWSVEIEPVLPPSRSRVPIAIELDEEDEQDASAQNGILEVALDANNDQIYGDMVDEWPTDQTAWPIQKMQNSSQVATETSGGKATQSATDSVVQPQPVEMVVEVLTSSN